MPSHVSHPASSGSSGDSSGTNAKDSFENSPPCEVQTPLEDSKKNNEKYIAQQSTHNFFAMALNQVLLRIGWIFKIESIIMPAVMTALGASDMQKSMLPILNRFGLGLPPILYARFLRRMRRKKWSLAASSIGMGIPFLLLATTWWTGVGRADGKIAAWWPYLFLLFYSIFFIIVGLYHISVNTLQGKLIRPNIRGRMMVVLNVVGAPIAITLAYFLLPKWLATSDGFTWIFAASGLLFAAGAIGALLLNEPPDDTGPSDSGLKKYFADVWAVLRNDKDFRKLAAVSAMFSMVIMLFPHYTSLSHKYFKFEMTELMTWVIIQNASTVVFSLLAGPMADRYGNRVVLHFTVLGAALPPLLALFLSSLSPELGGRYFYLVFAPIGLSPVTFRLLSNYALEIAEPEDHPKYMSALGVCGALPVLLFSLPLGLLATHFGLKLVFIIGALSIVIGGLLTFRLREPRHSQHGFSSLNAVD